MKNKKFDFDKFEQIVISIDLILTIVTFALFVILSAVMVFAVCRAMLGA